MKKIQIESLKSIKGGSRCGRLIGRISKAWYEGNYDKMHRLQDKFDDLGCSYDME